MAERNSMRIALSCAAVLMALVCLTQAGWMRHATADDSDPLRGKVKSLDETPFVTKAVLYNGMTVLVNEHQMHPVVSIQIYIKAGIVDEPQDGPGTARLMTALMGRSEPYETGGGNLKENARLLGGMPASATEYGYTRFEINVPASRWKKALEIQFNALMNISFDPETIEIEKRLLGEAADERLDNPSVLARESLMNLGFGSSRIEKWKSLSGGAPNIVSPENLAGFHRRLYVPERMMLVVSGDVRAGEVLNEAVRFYGDLKAAGTAGSSGRIQGSQNGFRYLGMKGNVQAPYLLFGFHAPAVDSRDYPAFEVLNAILGLGKGSVLSSRLKDRKRIILDGRSDLSAGPGFGYLTIQVKTMPEDIDRCEIAVLTELELIKRKPPTAVDMERAYAQLERSYRSRIETVSGRARMLAQFESWGDWKRIDRYIAELRSVSAEDVSRVAARYLRLENCSLLEYLPIRAESGNRTIGSVRGTLEGLLAPATDQEADLRQRETVLAIDLPKGQSNFKFSQIRYPFKIASVLRGPEIFVREDHTAPLIHMGIFFPGGRFAETQDNAGITNLLVRTMLQGTEKKSVWRFHRQLEIYGGQILPVVADDYFGFYFSIISGHFGEGFDLLTEAVKTPSLDPDALERQKALLRAEDMRSADWSVGIADSINPALFSGFPYSMPCLATQKSASGITADSLKAWHARFVENRRPVVVIVGDTEGTSLASYFVRHFSGSRFQETEIPYDFAAPLEKRDTIQTTWDRSRSLVAIGFHAPPVGDVDRHTVDVLQSYFGHMGRMEQAIRETMGSSDHIRVSYEPRLRGGSFLAYAVTSPGREEEVLNALEREFRHFVDNPVAYRDYRSAVNTAVGLFHSRRQSPFAEIVDVTMNALAGEGIEEYRSYQTKLQSVYEEDLKETAERIFNMDKAVFLRIKGKEPLYGHDPESE